MTILAGVLAKLLQDADKECRTLDGPALHRAQGRAQAFDGLLTILNDAAKPATQPLPTLRRDWQRMGAV